MTTAARASVVRITGEPTAVPQALRALHRALPVDAVVRVRLAAATRRGLGVAAAPTLGDLLHGAGFAEDEHSDAVDGRAAVRVRRLRTLPDSVAPGLRLLVVGLNPSLVAADAGFGFAGPTNRFWKAAVAAGAVTTARHPDGALALDRLGMTDLVKRATPRSSEVTAVEYRAGAGRVARLVGWLAPAATCLVGLEGWRAAVDRRAGPGWQPGGWGGRAVYVMPSTSGLNASARLDDLVGHLRAALAGPEP